MFLTLYTKPEECGLVALSNKFKLSAETNAWIPQFSLSVMMLHFYTSIRLPDPHGNVRVQTTKHQKR